MQNFIFTGISVDSMPVRQQRIRGNLITTKDVAKRFNVCVTRVQNRIDSGVMPVQIKIGKRLYWQSNQLDELKKAVEMPLPKKEKRKPPRILNEEQEEALFKKWNYGAGVSQGKLAQSVGMTQSNLSRVFTRVKLRHTNKA